MRASIFIAAIFSLLVASFVWPATAQVVQSIAAVVNDEVISVYDMDQRVNLLLATARIKDTPAARRRLRKRVLRGLIDEKLQLQEARRYNTAVTDADVKHGVGVVEKQNNMKPGDLKKFLSSKRIGFDIFVDRLRAEIAWTKLVGRRLRPSLRIGEDEIDEMEKQVAANQNEPAFLISEIFIPIDSAGEETEVRQTAERIIQDLKNGARFAELARQYSEGVTAFEGGDVGWVRTGQLAREVTEQLLIQERGKVSSPIRTSDGIYIIELRDRRSNNDPARATVSLKQIVLPLRQGASASEVTKQRRLAESISSTINTCEDVEGAISRLESPESGDLGTLDVADLPTEFQPVVLELPIGKGSAPIVRASSIHVIVVCDRRVDTIEPPTRESIALTLGNTRLALMAKRYLRDLRRDAIVEIR